MNKANAEGAEEAEDAEDCRGREDVLRARFPMKTLTLFELPFATARSTTPSPSKSAATIDSGDVPAGYGTPAPKPPDPLLSSTVMLLLPLFATARSVLPS